MGRERPKWHRIDWLILDEVAIVTYLSQHSLHLRLQQLESNQKVIENVNFLLLGGLKEFLSVSRTTDPLNCFGQRQAFSGEVSLSQFLAFLNCQGTCNELGKPRLTLF